MRYRRRTFTAAEIEQAKELRSRNTPWRHLGAMFNCGDEAIRRAIEPGYREMRALQNRQARHRIGRRSKNPRLVQPRFEIPEAVLTDRDRRNAIPRSLTAVLCGDPAPGQSALDRRGVA